MLNQLSQGLGQDWHVQVLTQGARVLGVVSKRERPRGGECWLQLGLREGDPSKLTHDTTVGHAEAMTSTQIPRKGGAFPLKKGPKDPPQAQL